MVKYFQFFVTSELFYLVLMMVRLHEGMLVGQYQNITAYLEPYLQNLANDSRLERIGKESLQSTGRSVNSDRGSHEPKAYRSLLTTLEDKLDLFHGTVVNYDNQKILCWTGEPNQYSDHQNFFYVEPGQESPSEIDVDHVQDSSGQWWKVGWATASVHSNSSITNAKCKTSAHNKSCGK